ncbi:hypothetical protein GHT06_008509 [Daphnia sinensis]|uniref:Uncharacterized protein n=1 Tax=Daphnia sinensis TaxID=1820382 RepID=A0AAD5LVF5_9CRUS|nr:hypothetical protein GHT06_008509 [Daphnia sinensis]
MTAQQVKKEPAKKFWNRRQTLYILILCVSTAIIVAAVICVALFKEKPISRSSLREVTVEIDALSQQNLQILYDKKFEIEIKPPVQVDTANDLLTATIKTTQGQLQNIRNTLGEMRNVTFVVA